MTDMKGDHFKIQTDSITEGNKTLVTQMESPVTTQQANMLEISSTNLPEFYI